MSLAASPIGVQALTAVPPAPRIPFGLGPGSNARLLHWAVVLADGPNRGCTRGGQRARGAGRKR